MDSFTTDFLADARPPSRIRIVRDTDSVTLVLLPSAERTGGMISAAVFLSVAVLAGTVASAVTGHYVLTTIAVGLGVALVLAWRGVRAHHETLEFREGGIRHDAGWGPHGSGQLRGGDGEGSVWARQLPPIVGASSPRNQGFTRRVEMPISVLHSLRLHRNVQLEWMQTSHLLTVEWQGRPRRLGVSTGPSEVEWLFRVLDELTRRTATPTPTQAHMKGAVEDAPVRSH